MTMAGQRERNAEDPEGDIAAALETGALDPDELEAEPEWWDEGSDDEV